MVCTEGVISDKADTEAARRATAGLTDGDGAAAAQDDSAGPAAGRAGPKTEWTEGVRTDREEIDWAGFRP